ncbi:hypothetical protein K438DRAFT_1990008 [Mycena galopus ATCC 62051]|nr:hypothetical protein K438DRAFT_1990008 [Mycena galopus ATCC 62051]
MSDAPRRSLRNMGNTGQGTAFHELVFLPTFVPELARPYHVPGENLALNPHMPQGDNLGMDTQTDASSSAAASDAGASENTTEEIAQPRLFYVHVTLEWAERVKSGRNARPKKVHESKLVSTPVDVLSTSRVAFIPLALGAHGYEDVYIAGVASGPAMRVFWTGSPGGKGGATVVLYDSDWKVIMQKLKATSKKLDTISVVFDLEGMEGFKQRSKRIHSPDPYETELSYGTHVPNTANYTPAQLAVAATIDEIKAAHSCKEHGTCFINAERRHLEMNRFRLSMWAQAVLAGQCAAADAPPKELVTKWTGVNTAESTSKPRGRTGPFPAQSSAMGSAASDTTNLILTTMVPVMAMMAQNMANNVSTPTAGIPPVPRAPPSPVQASSPPPPVEDDLDVFFDAFCRAKNIPSGHMDAARAHLRDAFYTPDILSEQSVTSERLQELTGLPEGSVLQLRKFARQWSGKIEGKRARRGIPF